MDKRRYLRITFVALLVTSLLVCSQATNFFVFRIPPDENVLAAQITFVPQVTPAQYYTQAPQPIATLVHSSTLQLLEKDAVYSPTYELVSCGGAPEHQNQICYQICYGGSCLFVSDKDHRVGLYVSLVDDREENLDVLESLDRDFVDALFAILGDCTEAAVKSSIVYGLFTVAVADPEPLSKSAVSALAAGSAIFLCGKSLWNQVSKKADKMEVIEDIKESTDTAIEILLDIEKYPSE